MSLALESSRIEGSQIINGISCVPIFPSDPPESGKNVGRTRQGENRRFPAQKDEELLASCSSSIGRNSDSGWLSFSDGEDSGEMEVQSSYKGPLDTMDALEDALPIRRSISKFYNGKSKSFTSLADASSSSAKALAKPDNSYTRKRKSLPALERNHRSFPSANASSGVSKRAMSSSRSTLALAFAMNNASEEPEPRLLPPLHPRQRKSPSSSSSNGSPPQWSRSSRSFSLTDLHCAGSWVSPGGKCGKL